MKLNRPVLRIVIGQYEDCQKVEVWNDDCEDLVHSVFILDGEDEEDEDEEDFADARRPHVADARRPHVAGGMAAGAFIDTLT